MTRLLKLVERVEEDLDIFLNDKSMTNEQAFKEIGAKNFMKLMDLLGKVDLLLRLQNN